jgi:hypothetical protein
LFPVTVPRSDAIGLALYTHEVASSVELRRGQFSDVKVNLR